ncbi:hypothetical protein OPS25_07715 [Alteromonas ponticola]|uniref:Uncharacterized protein n=1 Tax=Alteromonas aquimaris TaxID=2998417 RepID=A0ABT3P6I5_9ALTE|nr:hypothetical protein [Alteromonas aquimaris]MCW8108377.1 hypothetical protein [Alteromonas aquimaris]
MKQKKLKIFKDGNHVQTVTYQKDLYWKATHFIPDKQLPFYMYEPLETQKLKLQKGGYMNQTGFVGG